eukprot:128314_1
MMFLDFRRRFSMIVALFLICLIINVSAPPPVKPVKSSGRKRGFSMSGKMSGVKKSITSGVSAGVTRMRSLSTSRDPRGYGHATREERQSFIPKAAGEIHSYTHAGVSHSEPKREESAMHMPSHGLLSKKDAKTMIDNGYLDVQREIGGEEVMREQLNAWKSMVFDTAVSVFAKKTGKYTEMAADITVGILTGGHDSLVKVAKEAMLSQAKSAAMSEADGKLGITAEITKKGKKLWNEIKASPESAMYFIRNGHRDSVGDEKRRAAEGRKAESVGVHGSLKGLAVKTGFSTLKSAATTMATGAAIGAIVGGPIFPLTAAVGVGIAAGWTLGKAATKAVYITIRENQKKKMIGKHFDDFFGTFVNDLNEIEFGGYKFIFDDLGYERQVKLCFLMHKSTVADPDGHHPKLSVIMPDYVVTPFLDKEPEHAITDPLLGPAKVASHIVKVEDWRPINPPSGYGVGMSQEEVQEFLLETDPVTEGRGTPISAKPMSSAATAEVKPHESGDGTGVTPHARSEYHNKYDPSTEISGYNRKFDAIEHELQRQHLYSIHRYQDNESGESYWHGLMIGGLFGGSSVIILMLVFCLGLAFGLMGCWSYSKHKDLHANTFD